MFFCSLVLFGVSAMRKYNQRKVTAANLFAAFVVAPLCFAMVTIFTFGLIHSATGGHAGEVVFKLLGL